MPCNDGTFGNPDIATDRHSVTFDPCLGPELEIGAEDDDVTEDRFVDPEIGKDRGAPGIGRRCSGDHQRKQKEKEELG